MSLLYDGLNALPYTLNPVPLTFQRRSPIPTDWQNFNIGTVWINTITEQAYILMSLANNVADWVLFAGGGGNVTTFDADSGTAIPVAGLINVFGNGTTIATSASGNTIVITTTGEIATAYDGNTGSAVPSGGILNIVGDGTTAVTAAAGNTVTISTGGDVATTYDGNTGSATPSAGVIHIVGDGVTATTSATGSTVTISTTAFAETWVEVTSGSSAMAVNTGYIANFGTLVTLTMPATAARGSRLTITGKGAGGWKVAQNSGQTVYFGIATTMTGTGGSLASTAQRDTVDLVCITANTEWNVINSVGNITVT